jgi:phage replication O-like protein O
MDTIKSNDFHTRVPNKVLDALLKIRIPGEARQMLDTIIRQTYGYKNRPEDWIASSQFMRFTGLSRSAVYKGRRKLLEMNLIKITRRGQRLFYSVQEDVSRWKPSPKKESLLKGNEVSSKMDENCIPKGDPHVGSTERNSTTREMSPEEDVAIRRRAALEEIENEKRLQSGSATSAQNNGQGTPAQGDHVAFVQMQSLQERWNARMPAKVMLLSSQRIERLSARLTEPLFMNNFDKILDKILSNDFLSGKSRSGDSNFKGADFDWIIKDDVNYLKILEGKYEDGLRPKGYGKTVKTY